MNLRRLQPTAPLLASVALSCCACACANAQAQDAAREAGLGTERDNEVVLVHGEGVWGIDFVYTYGKATDGQPFSGARAVTGVQDTTVHVMAGREGSAEMARQFLSHAADDDYHMLGISLHSSSTTHPEKLNFWVHGVLYINGVEIPGGLLLGQGHHMTTNNWWAANADAANDSCSKDLRLLDARGKVWCLHEEGSSSANRFEVRACRALH